MFKITHYRCILMRLLILSMMDYLIQGRFWFIAQLKLQEVQLNEGISIGVVNKRINIFILFIWLAALLTFHIMKELICLETK